MEHRTLGEGTSRVIFISTKVNRVIRYFHSVCKAIPPFFLSLYSHKFASVQSEYFFHCRIYNITDTRYRYTYVLEYKQIVLCLSEPLQGTVARL